MYQETMRLPYGLDGLGGRLPKTIIIERLVYDFKTDWNYFKFLIDDDMCLSQKKWCYFDKETIIRNNPSFHNVAKL